MKVSRVATVLTTAGLAGVSAAADAKVIPLDFVKSTPPAGNTRRDLYRRAGTLNSPITNDGQLYFLNISVGTPPQSMAVYVDTGSSDLWVPSTDPDANFCEETQDGCGLGGFNPEQSSSAKELENMGDFGIKYGDGSTIEGVYFTDDVAIGQAKLSNVTMALAVDGDTSGLSNGLMGVGYVVNEAPTAKEQETRMLTPYPNIVAEMKAQNLISTLAYSVYLNDFQSGQGTILFGGVDKAKYTGKLGVVPVQPNPAYNKYYSGNTGGSYYGSTPSNGKPNVVYTSFYVPLTGIALGSTKYDLGMTYAPVLLDSGTSIMYVPDKAAEVIYKQSGARIDRTYGPLVSCNQANQDPFSFTFGDGGPVVNVSMSQVVRRFTDAQLQGLSQPVLNGQPACGFGITGAGDSEATSGQQATFILGDTFLTSAYVVYDLDNNQIGLAQGNPNVTSSSIVEISSTIPGDYTVTGASFSLASAAISSAIQTTRRLTATDLGVEETLAPSSMTGSVAFGSTPAATSGSGSSGSGTGSGGSGSSARSGSSAAPTVSQFTSASTSTASSMRLTGLLAVFVPVLLGIFSGGILLSWI